MKIWLTVVFLMNGVPQTPEGFMPLDMVDPDGNNMTYCLQKKEFAKTFFDGLGFKYKLKCIEAETQKEAYKQSIEAYKNGS